VPFKPVSSVRAAPATPLQLFDELPRMTGAVPELWRQQGDVLREYAANFVSEPDVAVELPTGTGKTIVGLLLADWRRRAHGKAVVYACPTHQLAHQVAEVARREGIPGVTLVGPHHRWAPAATSRYD
jgi:superfamily II DNA or RNA helicase